MSSQKTVFKFKKLFAIVNKNPPDSFNSLDKLHYYWPLPRYKSIMPRQIMMRLQSGRGNRVVMLAQPVQVAVVRQGKRRLTSSRCNLYYWVIPLNIVKCGTNISFFKENNPDAKKYEVHKFSLFCSNYYYYHYYFLNESLYINVKVGLPVAVVSQQDIGPGALDHLQTIFQDQR